MTNPPLDPLPTATHPLHAPASLVELSSCLEQCIDRKLGYVGSQRFVYFYYEPRGEEVIWNDGQSYGFGFGGWLTFTDQISPLGQRYGITLGDSHHRGEHVLVIDRELRHAYFADKQCAQAVVADQHLPATAG